MTYQVPLATDNTTLKSGYTPPANVYDIVLYRGEPPVLPTVTLVKGYTPPKSGYTVVLNKGLLRRRMEGVSLNAYQARQSGINIAHNLTVTPKGQAIALSLTSNRQMGINIGSFYQLKLSAFYPLAKGIETKTGDLILIGNRIWSHWLNYTHIANRHVVRVSDTVSYAKVLYEPNAKVISYEATVYNPQQMGINLANGVTNIEHGALVGSGHQSCTQHAIPVPCRYYPIPEPPPPPYQSVCDIRPPSSRLPLSLNRKRGQLSSSALPLPLMCWHDESPKFIPSLRSYIVHNVVTASIGGVQIDLHGFSIKADTSGYCWQGSIELTPSQYNKVKAKLDVERGNEPLVIVMLNNFPFAFIAEDIRRNRQFINQSFSIGGRSITARLGADYAHAQGLNGTSVIDQDLYASQIVQQQLADTGITLDKWAVADWLIPADTIAVTNKTPIAIIADIAKACGGFVFSHPSEAKLSILPRWKKPAWELATAMPDLVVNPDIWLSINDSKRTEPRYNAVMLFGSDGSMVYRNGEGLDKLAPLDNNQLYGDKACEIPKGVEILSDSGSHIDYSIKMRWAEKYNIPLAMLVGIWR